MADPERRSRRAEHRYAASPPRGHASRAAICAPPARPCAAPAREASDD